MNELLESTSLADPTIQECPWPYYRAMHERGFYFDQKLGMYICASYPLMREIMRNPKVFSNVNSQNVAQMRKPPAEVRAIQAESERPVNILVSSDPPEHARIRALLDEPFRPREIAQLRPEIQEIINNAIDQFIDHGEFDAVEQFAIPIPVTVIADMLGLARDKAADIKVWSDASVEPLGMMLSDERWIACAQSMAQFQEFISSELNDRQANPRKDLLTHLVQARDEDGRGLTLAEMLGITQQILVAGNETTTNGIAAGIQLLIENPLQQQKLRESPDLILTFVNEVLRLESPVQGLFRMVTQETEINGETVPEGARIMLRYAAANRDPDKYSEPDELDVCRKNAGTHVGFGAGIHHCLGANLAREEMVQAFTLLLQRIDGMRFKRDASELQHHPSLILRGLTCLPVEFELA
jgi:cytochrome P450